MSYNAPPPPPPPAGAPGTPYGQVPSTSPLAITSLVTGIVGLLFTCLCGFGVIISVVAIVTGFISRSQIAKSAGALKGNGMALSGIILGAVAVVLLIVGIILYASGALDYHFDTAP
ncbi:DUF4190 domain-containing protein [Nocardioides mangrovicus]|uniref:DUF4190 domain-containing protein n=1 Tax=Nocardioides mangrovicus TaxID=2478913 RepID=A0A3L8P4A1_9ACTN|nr:DUF4190 domain-containing protein [Nocardioides mangrovicus]RLV49533.1 DUF4190 domain-containing protein [Nocardioides mangrovicus]